jgi:cobalt-zinc-cadmium efflux system protein
MRVALAINAAMFLATALGGILTGSLALLADAGHVLSDVGGIAIGLVAAGLAARAPTPARTFGYHRSEILAALLNGIALVAVALLIVAGAVGRLSNPPEVDGIGVVAFGVAALVGNVAATWVLAGGSRADINLEGVLRHSAADALASLGVVLTGAILLTTGWNAIDPLMSLLIAGLIGAGSWRLLKEPVDVLMEAAPAGIDVQEVGSAMTSDPDVIEIHDLHVWTVTSDFPALAAHLVVRPGSDRDLVRGRVEEILASRFAIHHTTLQLVEARDRDELIAVEELRRR